MSVISRNAMTSIRCIMQIMCRGFLPGKSLLCGGTDCFVIVNAQKTNIIIERTQHPKPKVANEKLGFGKYMSDHMLEIDFDGQKWSTPRIVPYHNLVLDPAASVFHYGTAVASCSSFSLVVL